jgi:beta-lactamase regulating signal transducer with metallopeptidase domain
MRSLSGWGNAETIRLMGMALLHFLWQGVAIAAAAFTGMTLVRRAAGKYVVAVALLALMMASPVITFLVLAHTHDVRVTTPSATGLSSPEQPEFAAISSGPAQFFRLGAADAGRGSSIYLLWFVEAWFVGVVLLSLRPAAGFLLIERMRIKKGMAVTGALRARCLELQRRLGIGRIVQYCESLQLQAPAVVGWFRPIVLLPMSALTGLSPQQLESVIAHELAHVKRLDAFVNLFQIAVETLLFYHPAVWWLSKRIRVERENCCDDVAISVCGNAVEYARALATLAEWQSAPAMAMAMAMAANRSPLTERVARLLGVTKLNGGLRTAGITGSVLCLCASVLAGNAVLGAAQANKVTAEQRPTPVVQVVPPENHDAAIVVRPAKPLPEPVIEPGMMIMPAPAPSAAAKGSAMAQADAIASANQDEQEQENRTESSDARGGERKAFRTGSYIDGLKAEGFVDFSIDQLIAMKVQNVTPEYVHSIHALGLKPDVNEFIAMRVQGVSPELILELRDAGLAQNIDQIIAMRVQGVTPGYVKQLHEMGMDTDAGAVLAMKVQGVTSEYVREMRSVTDPKLSTRELITMSVQGVTPEYVRELKAMGFQLDADDVIAMKVQGVTAEYIKGLQSAGLKLDAHGVIAAKVQGITPEFIQKARSHGFQNLSIDKMMMLKHSGVLDE